MDEASIVAIGFGFFLGMIHFFNEAMKPTHGKARYCVVSFAAGISIAYLFLDLLPQTYEAATHLRHWVFAFLLLGFSLFHLAEKFIYQHADREHLAWELKEIHSVSFFAYHFIVGIAITGKVKGSILEGSLFLIPVALHTSLSAASLAGIHGQVRETLVTKIALSLSTLLGVFFALLVGIPAVIDNILVSLIAGVLLYIIVREFLPEKEKGQPAFFILGLALFVASSLILAAARA